MNRKDMIEACVKIINKSDQCDDIWDVAAFAISHALTGQQKDTLAQIVEKGPVSDGDVVSKSSRTDLIEMGLVSKAVVKGEEGYQVANYRGFAVYRAQSKLVGG
jgi:hypothetical protein